MLQVSLKIANFAACCYGASVVIRSFGEPGAATLAGLFYCASPTILFQQRDLSNANSSLRERKIRKK